jgi:hypothetical protein
MVAGPVSVRWRRSGARLATGSGAEGVARHLGAYGGDGLLRWLPRPAGRRDRAWLLWRRQRSAEGGAVRRRGSGGVGFYGRGAQETEPCRLGRRGVAPAGCPRTPASPGLARGGWKRQMGLRGGLVAGLGAGAGLTGPEIGAGPSWAKRKRGEKP